MSKKRKKNPQPKRTGPRCPKCNRATIDVGPTELHWCDGCKMQFDLSGDDGDYSDRNPAARLERAERRRG